MIALAAKTAPVLTPGEWLLLDLAVRGIAYHEGNPGYEAEQWYLDEKAAAA